MAKGWRRILKRASFFVVGAGTCTSLYLLSDKGNRRQFQFYRQALPILAHYTYSELTHPYWVKLRPQYRAKYPDVETLLDKLHKKYAQRVMDIILDLRGLYVKAGQYATSRPDIVPESWIDVLRSLQDGVPQKDIAYVRKVIDGELHNCPRFRKCAHSDIGSAKDQICCPQQTEQLTVDSVFSHIDPRALGAASIGQAHLATLKDTNKQVCVKIQYPEMEKLFAVDLSAIRWFVSLLEPAIGEALEEMESQFMKEFDYRIEAHNLQTAYDSTMPHFADRVCIPKPFSELCTKNLLVMEYIEGDKLEIAIRNQLRQYLRLVSATSGGHQNVDSLTSSMLMTEIKRLLFKNNGGMDPITELAGEGAADGSGDNDTLDERQKRGLLPTLEAAVERGAGSHWLWRFLRRPGNRWLIPPLLRVRQIMFNSAAFFYNSTLALFFTPIALLDIYLENLQRYGVEGVELQSYLDCFQRVPFVNYMQYPSLTVNISTSELRHESKEVGSGGRLQRHRSVSLPNPSAFLQTLFEVHGFQIFVNGCFNGDPHPGNVLLMDDGRLGLIDYGQFKYLSTAQRRMVAQLIVALSDRDTGKVVALSKEMGFRSKKMNERFIYLCAVVGFDRLDYELRGGQSTFAFLRELQQLDTLQRLPGDFYLVQRVVFLLRGLSQLLQFDCSVAKQWRPYALRFLNEIDTDTPVQNL